MRKVNAILGPILIILLLIHAISGAFQLWGILPGGSAVRQVLSYALLGLVAIHGVLGVWLTISTLISCKRAGRAYFRNNGRFWISRISGFAVLVLILYHYVVFAGESGEIFRLYPFREMTLAAHILLVLALLIHLAANIKPLYISFGIENRKYIKDTMIILSLVMLVCAAAFIYYYLRWNVVWRV